MPKKFALNRRYLVIGLLSAIALLLIWRLFFPAAPRKLPPEAAAQALVNTFDAPSYRFTTQSTIFLDGEQRLFCRLEGEKSGEDRHIYGELLGTPLNLYLVGQSLYQQSGQDKSWRKIADADLAAARKLVSEIAPESNFAYRETGPISYLGVEEYDGQKLHKMELHPLMADVWIENYFTDIVSTLWLDKEGKYLVRAQTTAVSAENPGVKLIIDNTFNSFGETIEIKEPL